MAMSLSLQALQGLRLESSVGRFQYALGLALIAHSCLALGCCHVQTVNLTIVCWYLVPSSSMACGGCLVCALNGYRCPRAFCPVIVCGCRLCAIGSLNLVKTASWVRIYYAEKKDSILFEKLLNM
jgi:hypothetical protein